MLSCSIDLSNACQNKCEFCLSDGNLNGQMLDFDLYCNLLHDLDSMGVESIVFSGGGEPLLYPKFRDAILAASAFGFKLGMITNGRKLDEYFDLLCNFVFVKVSLDAGSRKTYLKIKGSDSFGKVIQNIILSMDKTFINVGYVLTEENASELFDIDHLLSGVGAVSIKRNIFEVQRKPSLEACKVSDNLGIVTADGNVYYCSLKRWNPEYLLGNLKDESIIDIWERRDSISRKFQNCNDCRHGQTKHGGFV